MSPGDIIFSIQMEFTTAATSKCASYLKQFLARPPPTFSEGNLAMQLLDCAVQQDNHLRENGDEALIDDKTVFIVKRT